MNLGDYIGDTRTESLPPGFLKSIKIKYRHEASHVFPPQAESVARESHEKDPSIKATESKENEDVDNEKLTPSFMSWRVPSRLLNQRQGKPHGACTNETKGNHSATGVTRDVEQLPRQHTAPLLKRVCRQKKDDPAVKNIGRISQSGKCRSRQNIDTPALKSNEGSVIELRINSSSHGEKRNISVMENKRIPTSILRKHEQRSNESNKMLTKGEKMASSCALHKLTQDNQKSDQLPKLNISPQVSKHDCGEDETKGKTLPQLKTTKQDISISIKSPSSATMDQIHTWMDKSTKRERNVAFNVLSSFIQNEKVGMCKPKKNRILVALNALERKRTPSLQPLTSKDLADNLRVISFDKKDANNIHGKAQELKTWHHLPVYCHMDGHNKSAMFAQPGKPLQGHFSIHPEWGLHASLGMVNN